MGIRYYAYPVAARDVASARLDPFAYLSADPFADAWGLEQIDGPLWGPSDRPQPRILYLDKCWTYLQHLTADDRHAAARNLFQGMVTFHPEGYWDAFTAVLSPAEVAQAADDLDVIGGQELEVFCSARPRDARYIADYFEDARTFAHSLVERSEGLVYMIG